MKKILLILLFTLAFIFNPSLLAQGPEAYQYSEKIDEFQAQIAINQDATISITEYISYDFANRARHGIYRDIPYRFRKVEDGRSYEMKIDVLSVSDDTGKRYKYLTSNNISDGILRLKIGDPDRTIIGKHIYVINYKVYGALRYLPDHDELYWNITGNGWTVPIIKSSAIVAYPPDLKMEEVKQVCYTGPVGSTSADCVGYNEDNEAIFESRKILTSGEGLTVAVAFPKGHVATLLPALYVPWYQTWWGRVIIFSLIFLGLWWYLIYPIQIVMKWFRQGRDPKVGGPVRAWYDPPQARDGRSLTPAETGGLIDERIHPTEIWSTIVNLAQRGYLRIEERKKKDFYLVKSKDRDLNLLPFEQFLLGGIFKNSLKEVRIKDADLHSTISDVKNKMYEQLIEDGFFDKNPDNIRAFYWVMVFLAVFTFNPLLFISSLIFGLNMPKKTQLGAEQATVAKSLKNFLTSQERQLKFQASKQMMFERLLPFAIAFGVERIWADRFKDLALKQPSWYVGYGGGSFNSSSFTSNLNSSFNSFTSASTPSSSSSGFSGGSSGGGGGGGGGGSW